MVNDVVSSVVGLILREVYAVGVLVGRDCYCRFVGRRGMFISCEGLVLVVDRLVICSA